MRCKICGEEKSITFPYQFFYSKETGKNYPEIHNLKTEKGFVCPSCFMELYKEHDQNFLKILLYGLLIAIPLFLLVYYLLSTNPGMSENLKIILVFILLSVPAYLFIVFNTIISLLRFRKLKPEKYKSVMDALSKKDQGFVSRFVMYHRKMQLKDYRYFSTVKPKSQ